MACARNKPSEEVGVRAPGMRRRGGSGQLLAVALATWRLRREAAVIYIYRHQMLALACRGNEQPSNISARRYKSVQRVLGER